MEGANQWTDPNSSGSLVSDPDDASNTVFRGVQSGDYYHSIPTISTPGFIDDVYIDLSGANLVNPIPEPSQFALLGVAGLAVFFLRRRK